MSTTDPLLERNRQWIAEMKTTHPSLFDKMDAGQQPEFLWIGCADSRVAPEVITDSLPGTIFVHRNIANMVVPTDYNLLSTIYYAVSALKIKDIIVCGHYGCGGIHAALSHGSYGLLDNWLGHIKDVYCHYNDELKEIDDPERREDRFAEINVKEQVRNIAKLNFIQEAWLIRGYPRIHGWIFEHSTGRLIDLNLTISSENDVDEIYRLRRS